MPDVPHAGVVGVTVHAESPSHEHGMPLVLSSSSKTSCWLYSAVGVAVVEPVADEKPTYIPAAGLPSWL
jgi:hypothetical protein